MMEAMDMENRTADTLELCLILDNALSQKAEAEAELDAYKAETAPWSYSEAVVDAWETRIATLHDSAIYWADLIDSRINP